MAEKNGTAERPEVEQAIEAVAERHEQGAMQVRRLQREKERSEFVKEYLALCVRTGWHMNAKIVGVSGTAPNFMLQIPVEAQQASDDALHEYEAQIRQITEQGIKFAGE